jgi:hypothetical protein
MDAGADHRREQQRRAERFANQTLGEIWHQVGSAAFADRASCGRFLQPFVSLSWSRLRIGKATKIPMR